MTSDKNKSANAATEVKSRNLESSVDQFSQKYSARIKAEKVIYEHASKWADVSLSVGDPIPIIRDNQKVGEMSSTTLGGVAEVEKILTASQELKTNDIKNRLTELKTLQADAEALRDKLAEFDPFLLAAAVSDARDMHKDLSGRIIKALGADNAAFFGLDILSVGLHKQVMKLESELQNRGSIGPGRPKNKAAHDVAIAAAKFYTKMTGKWPTHGESPDGLTGEYTPFLKDLYIAFGWPKLSLRPGIDAAINSTNHDDLTYARMGLMAAISSDKWP